MRIGFDAKRYFANFTGLGNYSRTVLENLIKYHPEHQYLLYASQKQIDKAKAEISSSDNPLLRTPQSLKGKVSNSLWRSFFLRDDLEKDDINIYHGLSHEIPVGMQQKSKIKTVVTIHDLIFLKFPELYRRTERYIYLKKFRHSCQNADRVIAVSEQTKNDIVDIFKIPADKISVIYQSCQKEFFNKLDSQAKSDLETKYQLPKAYVLYVGSFTERKKVLHLIQALKILKPTLDFPIVLVGNGKGYKQKILDYISKHDLSSSVKMLSNVPNEDLPGIYQQASLFVYPSVYEGFGIPIIEALASGTPVITSQGGCFPEAGGPSSSYIEPGNIEELAFQIESILTDKPRQILMIQKGTEYVRRFQGKETADQLNALYLDLTRGGSISYLFK